MATSKNSVRIVPNATSKALVTAYKNNPKYGFIQLNQDIVSVENGWIRNRKRSCLVRAEIGDLNLFVSMFPDRTVPGRIQVQEYVESQVPDAVAKQFFNQDLDYEEMVRSYVKTTGNPGEELTKDGERIMRFSDYDASGEKQDVLVQHDNQEQLAGLRQARVAAQAEADANQNTGDADGEAGAPADGAPAAETGENQPEAELEGGEPVTAETPVETEA